MMYRPVLKETGSTQGPKPKSYPARDEALRQSKKLSHKTTEEPNRVMLYPRDRCPTVWVQATKSRTLNWKSAHQQSEFAGFFKGGGYIQKKDKLHRAHDSAKTSIEKNIIEMPETISTLVMKEGTMDYRPGNG